MYLDDYNLSAIVDFKFTTRKSTGLPTTLSGTPAVKVYKTNSTTETATGVTLTADFDSVTGLNHVRIDLSTDGTFYASGCDFSVVITAGTVDSISVVGETVAVFSILNRSALRPTVAGRTFDVSTGGEGGLDWSNIGTPGSTVNLSATTVGIVASVTALSAAAILSIWNLLTTDVGIVASSFAKLLKDTLNAAVGSRAIPGDAMTLSAAYDAAKTAASQASVDDLPTNSEFAAALAAADDATLAVLSSMSTSLSGMGTTISLIAGYVDTEVAAIKSVTDKLDTTLASNAGAWRFTAAALALAPSSSGSTVIMVSPLNAIVPSNTIVESGTTQAFRYCPLPVGPISIRDVNNDPITLTGGDLVMYCVNTANKVDFFTLKSTANQLTIGGDDENQISVDYTPTVAGRYWRRTYWKPSGGTKWFEIETGFWQIDDGPNPADL